MSKRTRRVVLPLFVPEEPLHYGDIVCYVNHTSYHDAPLMYISPCGHSIHGDGLIDLISVAGLPFPEEIEHKAAAMWQRCPHV